MHVFSITIRATTRNGCLLLISRDTSRGFECSLKLGSCSPFRQPCVGGLPLGTRSSRYFGHLMWFNSIGSCPCSSSHSSCPIFPNSVPRYHRPASTTTPLSRPTAFAPDPHRSCPSNGPPNWIASNAVAQRPTRPGNSARRRCPGLQSHQRSRCQTSSEPAISLAIRRSRRGCRISAPTTHRDLKVLINPLLQPPHRIDRQLSRTLTHPPSLPLLSSPHPLPHPPLPHHLLHERAPFADQRMRRGHGLERNILACGLRR